MLNHILVTDESRLIREAIAKILLSCGINKSEISCIESIEDAIEFVQFSPINLLICSDNIGPQSPNQLRNKLKKLSKNKAIPLLILSHQEEPLTSTRIAAQQDSSIYIFKPFKKKSIIKALFSLTKNEKFNLTDNKSPPMSVKNSSSCSATCEPKNVEQNTAYKPSILIVDDESSNIDVAAGNLRHLYQVIAAKSGEHALRIVNREKYSINLILLDIMMPDMDGYQVCSALKSNKETAHIPIIFLSAKSEVSDIKHGFDLGAVDYITKPLNGDLLRARVATHIRLQQQNSALADQVTTLRENAKLREDIEKITHHDLKGPLNNILFETYRLADQTAAKSINKAVNNVVDMINNSLNLYKIEQNIYQLSPQKINLNQIITDAVNAISQVSTEKSLHITLSGFAQTQFISGEPLLCLSIFNNLIKNAVEASSINSPLLLSLNSESNQVRFQIINQGIIPKNIRASLFDKYSSSNHQTGTGLGTYSAKLMTEVQHGEIYFDIIDERQTVFVVKLPLA